MTRLLPSPRHALIVARVEQLRQWRRSFGKSLAYMVATAVLGLFLVVASAGVAFGGYLAGSAVRDGSVSDPVAGAQFVVAGIVAFTAFVVAFRTISEAGRPDRADGMLTTVPHRDLVGGIVLSEAVIAASLFGLPAVGGAIGFGVGTGSPAGAALVALAFFSAGAVAVSVGFAAGMAVRNAVARSALVVRHRLKIGALAFVVYMVLVVTDTLLAVVQPVLAGFRRTPVAWYADLGLLAVADGASPFRALAALAATPVVVGLAVAVSVRLAELLWYADPVDSTAGESTSGLSTGLAAGPAGRLLPRRVGQVAVKGWLRARRSPIRLVFVAYPLFLLAAPVSEAIQTGEVPASLPATVALYGAWATGAAFTLNPLGEEGGVLPATLTSGVSGREFVGGGMVAGAVVGAPATGLATLAAGLAGPQGVAAAAALAAFAAALAVTATGIAAGVGVVFPRFESVRITRSHRAVVPSMYGFAGYSVVLVVASLPGLIAQVPFAVPLVESATGLPAATVAPVGAAATLILAGACGIAGFRLAARRFDGYTL